MELPPTMQCGHSKCEANGAIPKAVGEKTNCLLHFSYSSPIEENLNILVKMHAFRLIYKYNYIVRFVV